MHLRWLDPHAPDPRDLAGAAAVLEAARQAEYPHEPTVTAGFLATRLRHGFDGHPAPTAVAVVRAGRVDGLLEVDLPGWDNAHLGRVDVTVDPYARRQGLGRRLFEAGLARVREQGRRLVHAYGFDLPATVAFADAMGLARAGVEAKRRLVLPEVDRGRLDEIYVDIGNSQASGYELVRIESHAPESMLADLVELSKCINDAPIDQMEIEDDVYTPQRIQTFERVQQAHGRRFYRLVARHQATGELAGYTMVAVESQLPGYGHQYDTAVAQAHRGHRLGMFLKIGMLNWMAEAEPQLRVLDTWNATSNEHMVAVNEALGYRLLTHGFGWQREA